ncbi:hypothetical protein KKG46_01330 [Patescibacteria group bacterium]|nr:hypothetical protein [Patescibacteria group bacterium]
MTLDEWRFSTRMAWENSFMRWASIVTITLLLIVSTYSAVRLVATAIPSGFIVTHYTVYLGIDQVLPMPWIFAIIFTPIALVSATLFVSFGFFRDDGIASHALLLLSILSTIIWSIQLYHLIKINI